MPAFDKGNLRGHSVFSQKVEKKQKKMQNLVSLYISLTTLGFYFKVLASGLLCLELICEKSA